MDSHVAAVSISRVSFTQLKVAREILVVTVKSPWRLMWKGVLNGAFYDFKIWVADLTFGFLQSLFPFSHARFYF